MAVELELLTGYLDEEGLEYAIAKDGATIFVPFGTLTVRVHLCEDGEGLIVVVPEVFNLSDTEHREACLAYMANHNYRMKLGMMGYDPRDGEVDVSDFVPIEDGTLTRAQFLRVVHTVARVAGTERRRIRRVCYGLDPDDESADEEHERPEAAEDELPEGVRRMFEELEGESESAWLDLDNLPEPPIDESEWMRRVVAAFQLLCADMDQTDDLERFRTDVWPRLNELREASIGHGSAYLTRQVAVQFGCTPEEELVLLFMVARQAGCDVRINSHEIGVIHGPPGDDEAAGRAAARLLELGAIEPADRDERDPFRLTERYLEELAPVLPFTYRPRPEAFTADDLPAAPVDERRWLELVHQALDADVGDLTVSQTVTLLQREVWPRLLGLREESQAAGETFETARLVLEHDLGSREELVVAFVAARSADGDRRVTNQAMAQVYEQGLDPDEALRRLHKLTTKGFLESSDHDGRPPHTLGELGGAWLPA